MNGVGIGEYGVDIGEYDVDIGEWLQRCYTNTKIAGSNPGRYTT